MLRRSLPTPRSLKRQVRILGENLGEEVDEDAHLRCQSASSRMDRTDRKLGRFVLAQNSLHGAGSNLAGKKPPRGVGQPQIGENSRANLLRIVGAKLSLGLVHQV